MTTKLTVLVVDDEPDKRLLLAFALENEGYEVHTAVDGVSGLQAVETYQPDLIVTDRSMPAMEGIEFCRQLKLDLELARIPVILASAHPVEPGDAAVWDEFWQKPVSLVVMVASVRRLLNASS